jgi:hypothetical protein
MRLIAVLIVLALTCGGRAVLAQAVYGWCHRIDLLTSNPFTLFEGVWLTGGGLWSDTPNRINASYTAPAVVSASLVVVEVKVYYIGQPNAPRLAGVAFGTPYENTIFPYTSGAASQISEQFIYPVTVSRDFILQWTGGANTRAEIRAVTFLGSLNAYNPFGFTNCSIRDALIATPVSPFTGFSAGDMVESLSDADRMLSSVPGSVAAFVPDENGIQLFRYVKWLATPQAIQDISGPFSPVLSRVGVLFTIVFALAAVYALVYAAINAAKWAIWIFGKIVLILQGIRALLPF